MPKATMTAKAGRCLPVTHRMRSCSHWRLCARSIRYFARVPTLRRPYLLGLHDQLDGRAFEGGRRPLNWNLLVAHQGNIAQCEAKLSVGDLAARRGGKVVALAMPMRVASRLNFLTGVILDMLPGWHDAMMLPPDRKLQLLSDPVERRRLAELALGPKCLHN